MKIRTALVLATTAIFPGITLAHDDHAPIDPNLAIEDRIEAVDTAFGRMGANREVNRTVDLSLGDDMRFTPSSLTFAQGDTVRIKLHNTGTTAHEFILGTAEEIRQHAEMMKRFPTMEHNDPSSKRLRPGQSAEIIWQFTRPGDFVFACLLPGHAEAGMRGTIVVTAAAGTAGDTLPAAPATAAPAADAGEPTELSHGEVLKIDAARRKITIRHGAIRNLGMPGMTMTFRVADAALLDGIAVGDRIDFRAEDEETAGLTVTRLTKAP